MEAPFQCSECPTKKTFQTRRRYTQHVRENHRKVPYSCHYCGYQTRFKGTLIRHVDRHQAFNDNEHSKKKHVPFRSHRCPMCLFDCATRQKMVVHYVNNHGVSIDEQQLEFDDHAAFLVWKERIEQSEVCQFFSRTGPLDRRNVRIRYYRCFRDGHFLSKGKGLRQMKKKGSIKINSVCPAMMKTEEDKTTGAVRVTYIHTHVGHLQEFGHLNLLKSKRAEIAQNIPYGIILDKETNDVYDSCDVVFGSYDGVANEIVICELQGNSIEEIIVRDFSKNSSSLCNVELDEKKAQIRSRFESLMKKIQSDDHAEILWKALLSVEKTFEENPSLPITSGESSKKINANKNIFS